MLRWIKKGGWIILLTVVIFLAYCTFYLSTRRESPEFDKPGVSLEISSLPSTLSISPLYLSIAPPEETPSDGFDPSNPEPPGDFPESESPSPEESPPDGFDPSNPEPSGDSLENILPDGDIADMPYSDSDTENGGIEEDDESYLEFDYYSDDIAGDELAVLIQIRDTLSVIMHIMLIAIACIAVWLILLPVWRLTQS